MSLNKTSESLDHNDKVNIELKILKEKIDLGIQEAKQLAEKVDSFWVTVGYYMDKDKKPVLAGKAEQSVIADLLMCKDAKTEAVKLLLDEFDKSPSFEWKVTLRLSRGHTRLYDYSGCGYNYQNAFLQDTSSVTTLDFFFCKKQPSPLPTEAV